MHHVKLSDNGAVENIVSFNDDGEMVTRDVMSGDRVQSVLDSNAFLRNHAVANRRAQGRHAARIPITTWHSWRKTWMENLSDKWTWQTYLAAKLADSDNAYLRTGVKEIGLSERNKTGATAPKMKPMQAHAQRLKALHDDKAGIAGRRQHVAGAGRSDDERGHRNIPADRRGPHHAAHPSNGS